MGTILIKRDPAAIGAALISVLAVLGVWLDWDPTLTAALVAVVTAGVGVLQALNTFGTDQFTSVAVAFASAVLTLLIAFQVPLSDDVVTAILAGVPIILALFVRNGVTNRYGVDGEKRPVGADVAPVGDAGPTSTTVYTSDPKRAATYYPNEGQGPGGGG